VPPESEDRAPASGAPSPPVSPAATEPLSAPRRPPGHLRSIGLLARADLDSLWHSWLCRGFLIASGIVTVLALKGMQAEQKAANQMLEAVYAMYLLVWMHGVVFIAGGAFAREQDCLNDAILSRGLTRGEYLGAKLVARAFAVLILIGGVLAPASFWAIRQDQLLRSDTGQVVSRARNTKIEPWDPLKLFAATDGAVVTVAIELGDSVRAGDMLVTLDDRPLFDLLETERRAEENARNDVATAQRRREDALRAVSQTEDALARAEQALVAKDLLSRQEQTDRETELRARQRDLQTAENQARIALDAIATAERAVENAQARVREARKRLARVTVTAPLSGIVTELVVQPGQHVPLGAHLLTLARAEDYLVRVPVYDFDEFKRLKPGLKAHITIGKSEFEGTLDRLGATTQDDRWGRPSNVALVRFRGDGTPGLLGLNADVRIALPPPEKPAGRVAAILDTLTGRGEDDLASRTTSVTVARMGLGLAKVLGCAGLLVALTLLLLVVSRSPLVAILASAGLWHVSNLLFDFAGLPELSYLEMVRTLDKTLGGVTAAADELAALAWLYGIAVLLAVAALGLFVVRDPPK